MPRSLQVIVIRMKGGAKWIRRPAINLDERISPAQPISKVMCLLEDLQNSLVTEGLDGLHMLPGSCIPRLPGEIGRIPFLVLGSQHYERLAVVYHAILFEELNGVLVLIE